LIFNIGDVTLLLRKMSEGMENLKVKIENLYGIKLLNQNFKFNGESQLICIYAKNGTMKTSFLNSVSKNNEVVIENTFENIIGIESINHEYKLDNNLLNVILRIDSKERKLIKRYEEQKNIIEKKIIEYKSIYDFENKKNADFFESILELKLNELPEVEINIDPSNYKLLLKSNLKKLLTGKFIKLIKEINHDMFEIQKDFKSVFSNDFTPVELFFIIEELNVNGFFALNHFIILKNGDEFINIGSKEDVKKINIDEKLKELSDHISKKFPKPKDRASIYNIIINNLILFTNDFETIKTVLYCSVKDIKKYHKVCNNLEKIKKRLIEKYKKENVNDFLSLFNNSFSFPFEIILEENVLKIKDENKNEVAEEKLKNGISTGEKRAWYLLKVFYEILVTNKDEKILYIMDDIIDSFDSSNKYATIDMIKRVERETNNHIILLTHSYDFYKNLSITNKESNNLRAYKFEDKIIFKTMKYQRNFINFFKSNIKEEKYKLALLPFTRNIIENTNKDEYFEFFSDLLHYTPNIKEIKMNNLIGKYKEIYEGIDEKNIKDKNLFYYDVLEKESLEIIKGNKDELEDMIILSIYFRIKLEEFILKSLDIDIVEIWDDNYKFNPVMNLINKYEKFERKDDKLLKIFYKINAVTASNIHINSFMVDSILDMNIEDYIKLSKKMQDYGILDKGH